MMGDTKPKEPKDELPEITGSLDTRDDADALDKRPSEEQKDEAS